MSILTFLKYPKFPSRQSWLVACVCAFGLYTIPSLAASKAAEIAGYRALVDQDLRLATTGYRLAFANRALCAQTERNPGFVLHDILQYPNADTARAAFGFSRPVSVSVIVPGSAAERSGLRVGDALTGVAYQAFDWTKIPTKTGYDRVAAVKADIRQRLATQQGVALQIHRAGKPLNIILEPEAICASDFQIDTIDGKDAGADGYMVSVSLPLARYAADDQEFAAIVAHEMAHNILRHRARLDEAKQGKNRKAVLATEIEADRLSVWLMANAGYDPGAAVRFAQRCRKDSCLGLFTDGMHPSWKRRGEILTSEIAAIETAPKTDGLVTPPLLSAANMLPANKMRTVRNSN